MLMALSRGSGAVMRPDSFADFVSALYKSFVCLLNLLSYFLILSSLLNYFLTRLLPDLSIYFF